MTLETTPPPVLPGVGTDNRVEQPGEPQSNSVVRLFPEAASDEEAVADLERLPSNLTIGELLAIDFAPVQFVVDGLVPEGLALLAGDPKVGKSWWALAIASGEVHGRRRRTGSVLYLALEDNPRRLRSRLEVLRTGGLELDPSVELATSWPTLQQGGVEHIGRWLDERGDACLVVVDTLGRFRGSHGSGGYNYQDDVEALAQLHGLSSRHGGLAVIVVHHTRKGEADDWTHLISGTQGLAGTADTLMWLHRSRGQGGGGLKVTGRDLEEDISLALTLEDGLWQVGGSLRQLIYAHFREVGQPVSLADLRELLPERSPSTVKTTVQRLEKDGILSRVEAGVYRLTVTP